MQPQYAPQYPQQVPQQYPPQYPVQPGYPPQQGYAPQYPVQPQYAPQAPPMAPPVNGSLDEFFGQPGGGSGASWKFKDKPMGTTYSGIVARPIGSGDVRQQTGPTGPVFFKDGRPKFVMIVPMIVHPTTEYPEGTAAWWVKGQSRDELVRAMAEAGAPEGPPEAGAGISVTLVGQRPVPGMSPAYQYRVHYVRPNSPPLQATDSPTYNPPQQAQPAPQAPQPQYAPNAQGYQGGYQGGYAPTGAQITYNQPAPAQAAPTGPQYAPQAAPAPQAQPTHVMGMDGSMIPALNIGSTVTPPLAAQTTAPIAATGLNPDQQALLAKLTGG